MKKVVLSVLLTTVYNMFLSSDQYELLLDQPKTLLPCPEDHVLRKYDQPTHEKCFAELNFGYNL